MCRHPAVLAIWPGQSLPFDLPDKDPGHAKIPKYKHMTRALARPAMPNAHGRVIDTQGDFIRPPNVSSFCWLRLRQRYAQHPFVTSGQVWAAQKTRTRGRCNGHYGIPQLAGVSRCGSQENGPNKKPGPCFMQRPGNQNN